MAKNNLGKRFGNELSNFQLKCEELFLMSYKIYKQILKI